MRRFRRGFSLVELQFGLLLFIICVVGLFEAVSFGLKAHRKGESARQATAQCREILSRLQAELATAVALSTFQPDPLNGVDQDFQSAVLWPDPYPEFANVFSEPFYKRERATVTLPGGRAQDVDRVSNRLILSRPGKQADVNYNDRDYHQFVFVEYVVPPAKTDGTGQNRLYRRVYQVATTPFGDPRGVEKKGVRRTVDPAFFALDPNDPLSNPNLVGATLTQQQKVDQYVVLELPRPDDQMSFTVEHPRYTDPRGRPSPAYDPSLFTLNVTVSLNRTGKQANDFMAIRSLSEQARVKSGQ